LKIQKKKYSNRINITRKTNKYGLIQNPTTFIDKRNIMNYIKAIIQNKYSSENNKTFIIFSDNGSNIYNNDIDSLIYITKGHQSMYISTGKLGSEEDDLHIFLLMLLICRNNLLVNKIKSYMIFSYDNMHWLEEFIKILSIEIKYTFCEFDYFSNIISRTCNNFMYPFLLFLNNLPEIELDNSIAMLTRLLNDTRKITSSLENKKLKEPKILNSLLHLCTFKMLFFKI